MALWGRRHIILFSDMVLKLYFVYFSKSQSDPQKYMDVLNLFFYPLHFLLWFKGPDPTVTAEETLTFFTKFCFKLNLNRNAEPHIIFSIHLIQYCKIFNVHRKKKIYYTLMSSCIYCLDILCVIYIFRFQQSS